MPAADLARVEVSLPVDAGTATLAGYAAAMLVGTSGP